MYRIALKMLIGDRAKFLMLLSALTFSTLLMSQQVAVFLGLMRWTTTTLRNIHIPIWVVDSKVEQVNEVNAMRDTDLSRVRSVPGVSWAVPLFQTAQQVRLRNGAFKTVLLLGVDAATLIGAPRTLIAGRVEDLRQANAIIVDSYGIERLSLSAGSPVKVGDTMEINDHEVRIVGICDIERSFTGLPYVYTTYGRALEIVPETRRNLSFVLVQPDKGLPATQVARKIEQVTGLKSYTEDEFFWSTIWWYVANTGIPISFGTTIVLGFLVGIAVAGQTFYMFILENLGNLGALKAMGANNLLLSRMLLLQAFVVGLFGYGIGVGGAALFGMIAIKFHQPPFYFSHYILIGTLLSILLICAVAAFTGINKIRKLEAAEVFRA